MLDMMRAFSGRRPDNLGATTLQVTGSPSVTRSSSLEGVTTSHNPAVSLQDAVQFKNPLAAMHLLPVSLLEQEYDALAPQVRQLVSDKIGMAMSISTYNLPEAINILLSAVADVQWIIDSLIQDMAGRTLTSRQTAQIGSLKALQKSVVGQIFSFLGLETPENNQKQVNLAQIPGIQDILLPQSNQLLTTGVG
jgi:hypothetical protein